MGRVAVGLLHYPIQDKNKNIVATNILNLDIHDIARACRTYGVERYYLIHKSEEQLMFVSRVLEHWKLGRGKKFNPRRAEALTQTYTAPSLEHAISEWSPEAKLVATSARSDLGIPLKSFVELRREIQDTENTYFLLFGTGYGLTQATLESCAYLLEPIRGGAEDGFAHLSVRSAVSICLDRLLSS